MSPLISYSRILVRLKALRRRLLLLNLNTAALAALAYLAGAFLVATSFSLSGFAPVGLRVGWWLVVFGGAAAILGPVFWRYILFPPSPEKLALVVEARHPDLKNRLIASLQLKRYLTTNPEGYSSDLVGQTVQEADQLSAEIDMTACVDRSPLKQGVKRAGIMAVLIIATVFFFPGAVDRAVSSFMQPLTPLEEPISYSMTIYPGDAEVIKFDTLAVRAVLQGTNLPQMIEFSHHAEGGNWISEELSGLSYASSSSLSGPDSVVFAYRLGPLMRDVVYTFSTARLNSPVYTVHALDRPRVTGIRLSHFYPAYTGLTPLVVDENDGAISALAGTDVDLTVRANKTLAAAEIVLDDGTVIAMEVRDRAAVGRISITRDATYHFRLVDPQGYENPHPIEYPIGRLKDAYPRVEILLPGHDADLDEEMAVNLKVAAVDDFGFSDMMLIYRWLSGGQLREEKHLTLPLPTERSSAVEVNYWWDIELIGMMPSDVVSYHVEVSDNDRVSGPKSSVSKTYTLRFPSLDEMIAEIDARQDENVMDLEEIFRGEQELAEELKQLYREMLKADEIDWQSQKQLEALGERRSELTQEFGEVAEEFSQNAAEIEQNKLASTEMLAKLAEAQELFEEVATEEMKEAARKLAEAMRNLDPNELAEALEDMQVSTEEMIKRLEQTIAYLKKLQAEQRIDQMVKRAEDLLKRQEQLDEQADSTTEEELPPLAENQESLKDDFDEFAEELAALEQSLNEANLAPTAITEQFCRAGKQCSAPQAMAQAAQAMQQPNKSQAQESGQNAEDALQEMVSKMQNLQQMMSNSMQEEVAAMLREALDRALYLSENQEDLLSSTNELDNRSSALRDLAELQADLLAGTQRLEAALKEIGKKSMCLGGMAGGLEGVQQRMGRSADMLTQQNGRGATSQQQEAMVGLNQTAQQLLQGMEKNSGQCNKSGSCSKPGGAMSQMQSMCNQQGRLNTLMQQLTDNMGPGMTTEERLGLSRIRGEQQAIRNGIQDMQEKHPKQRNILGRLDKLGEEMKMVIEDLEHYEASHQTLDRMRRLYARMLDFQHSLHRQDYKEDRRARFGKDIWRDSPADIDLGAEDFEGEFSRLLERYLEEGYPKAYESLIKSYYRELLEEQRLQTGPLK